MLATVKHEVIHALVSPSLSSPPPAPPAPPPPPYRTVVRSSSSCDSALLLQGFSAGLFAFYRDDEGAPLTPRYASGLPAFNERSEVTPPRLSPLLIWYPVPCYPPQPGAVPVVSAGTLPSLGLYQ